MPTTRTAVIWRAPFTSVQVLQPLPGGGPFTDVRAITPDGSVAVGGATDITGRWKAVRWNTTTLAVTQLADVLPSQDCIAALVSADASVIIGGPQVGTTEGSIQVQPVVRYTDGGTTGVLLHDQTGGTNTFNEWGDSPVLGRLISDDGVVNTALNGSMTSDFSTGKWINGSYTSLVGIATGIADVLPQGIGCSQNGSIVVGHSGTQGFTGYGDACYWAGPTLHRLAAIPGTQPVAFFTNADGSLIWGVAGTPYYWSSVTTPTGDGVHWGVAHAVDTFGNSRITGAAYDPGVAIAVGYDSSVGKAYKWNGTTATELGAASGGSSAAAFGCNHDGSIAVGYSYDASFRKLAVRWDAANAVHVLPSLADSDDYFQGVAFGISRDGSVIFGLIDLPSETPTGITLTDAELLFTPTASFMDLSVEANRRLFVAAEGTPQWMGAHGAIPFGGDTPQVYLTTLGPPADFTQNNGPGGGFPVSGTISGADGPGCTDYFIPEAAGPASKPEWRLTVSDDGSRTWSRLVKPREIGVTGAYKTRLRWLKMGQFRQRVIKLECTDPIRRNIIGIYMDNEQGSI